MVYLRLIGTKSSGDYIASGQVSFDDFVAGQAKWKMSDSKITIPTSGWYEITISTLHYRLH